MEKLGSIINKMQETPMFYLFSSSKELFHSNFWYWLSQLNKEETLKLFVDTQSLPKIGDIEREKRIASHKEKAVLDLIFYDAENKPAVVIENKVKDFPTTDQLNRIKTACQNQNTQYILTTLFTFPGLHFDGWKIVPYREIANRIDKAKFTDNLYWQNLIEDYKSFLHLLADLAECEELEITSNYDFARAHKRNEYLFQQLDQIKLSEAYSKMRASHLISIFNERNKYPRLKASYQINNRKATLHFEMPIENTDYAIGVQIEDTQFRKFVSLLSGNRKIEEFAINLKSNNILFDNGFKKKRGKGDFGNYGDNFRYQYTEIKDPCSFVEIFQKIDAELDIITQSIGEIHKHIPQ